MLHSFCVTLFPCYIFSSCTLFMSHPFSCCTVFMLYLSCSHFTLHFFRVARILYCTFSMLHFFMLKSFHIAHFWSCARFVLHFFPVVLFHAELFPCCTFSSVASCCTISVLYSFRAILFPCCTFYMLYSFPVEPFFELHFFRVALFSYCTFFLMALFWNCTFLEIHHRTFFNMTWDWKLWGRDNFFGFFSHLFSPLDFKHFSVFYGILSKFLPLFLFWYPSFNNIRNFVCYLLSRFTGNGINIIKTKRN